MAKVTALAFGSLLGGFARYYLAGFIYRVFGALFPYGTLVVNLLGCFLIGFLSALADEKLLLGPNARIFLMIGFCGAFTTFSTFMLETANLIRDGQTMSALLNVMISVLFGFLVFRLGMLAAELM